MFSSLGGSLNGKPLTLHETNYHYKAYIENLLNYGSDSCNSNFWFLDSPGALKDNSGYTSRLTYLNNSQTVELYARLHADLFNSDKMLINGVAMNIKLTSAPEAFYLLGLSDDTKVRIKILDATLFIPQLELNTLLFYLTQMF
jgi:hypothetical protein